MADAPRLLHRRSQHGYTDRPEMAMFAEPEAVPAEDQEWITYRSHHTARDAQLLEWRTRRARIEANIDWLAAQQLGEYAQLRVARRQLARLDKLIASG